MPITHKQANAILQLHAALELPNESGLLSVAVQQVIDRLNIEMQCRGMALRNGEPLGLAEE